MTRPNQNFVSEHKVLFFFIFIVFPITFITPRGCLHESRPAWPPPGLAFLFQPHVHLVLQIHKPIFSFKVAKDYNDLLRSIRGATSSWNARGVPLRRHLFNLPCLEVDETS